MLRTVYIFCLTTEAYHISVVIATTQDVKSNVKMYQRFLELLCKTNKTPYRVSKDTGISQSALSDWKTGRSKPKADKLKILADYFNVSVEYFLE